jgi:hypothetical protein
MDALRFLRKQNLERVGLAIRVPVAPRSTLLAVDLTVLDLERDGLAIDATFRI